MKEKDRKYYMLYIKHISWFDVHSNLLCKWIWNLKHIDEKIKFSFLYKKQNEA